MKALGFFTATLLVAFFAAFAKAWVGIALYNWFLLPLGAPLLTMGQLYGVLLFVKLVSASRPDEKAKDKEYGAMLMEGIIYVLVSGGLAWGVGYVAHTIIY